MMCIHVIHTYQYDYRGRLDSADHEHCTSYRLDLSVGFKELRFLEAARWLVFDSPLPKNGSRTQVKRTRTTRPAFC